MKSNLSLGKKAGVYFTIFQVLMATIFVVFVAYYVNNEMEDTNSIRLYLSRDIAMNLHTSYGIPGNSFNSYNIPLKRHLYKSDTIQTLDFEFKDNLVSVSGKKFPYADSSIIENNLVSAKNKTDIYLKNYDYIIKTGYESDQLNNLRSKQLKYPYIDTYDFYWNQKPIVIHDNISKENKFFGTFNTKYGNKIKLHDKIIPQDAVIYLKVSYDNSNNLVAEIPYDKALKSRKFASILINDLIDIKIKEEDKSIDRAYITIIESNENAEVVVKLTIGRNLNYELIQLPDIIYKSMGEYFK